MALLHVDFFSEVLDMCVEMDVILPDHSDEETYPTLYLVHGMSSDHTSWQRKTSIERYAQEHGFAVVMPAVHLGWYTNMAVGKNYCTYISEEVPRFCHTMFPKMSRRREDTFAAGLSMGGYGALKLGICAPESFRAVAALSGAVEIVSDCHNQIKKYEGLGLSSEIWRDVFGPTEQLEGSENDLTFRARELAKTNLPKPSIYIWCGTEDDAIYEGNVLMGKRLSQMGYEVWYEDSPGDHQWKYWDEKIQLALDWFSSMRARDNQEAPQPERKEQ